MIQMPMVKQTTSPNFSRTFITFDKCFIHRTEGPTAEGAVAWLCSPRAGASTHLVSRGDGSLVYQLVPLAYKAWAQCAYNGQGVSIEYPGYTANGVPDALAKQMGIEVAWLLHAGGLPCQHAIGGQGRGYCQHADLGAAGGSHHDCCAPGSSDWAKIEACIKAAYDELAAGPLPPFALQGLPSTAQVSPPPAALPEPTHGGLPRHDLSVGSIEWCQMALNAIHVTMIPLVVDGQAGPLTRAAVARFQGQHGLYVDGEIGPQTIAALQKALSASVSA